MCAAEHEFLVGILRPVVAEAIAGGAAAVPHTGWVVGRVGRVIGERTAVVAPNRVVPVFEQVRVPGAARGGPRDPRLRFVSRVDNGTHVLFGSRLGPYAESEITLARQLLPALEKDMLCLADRNFFGYPLWKQARGTGADLLWRVKKNLRLPVERRLEDGSYLSCVYSSERDRRRQTNGIKVRVIEYRIEGAGNAEPLYRLLTSLLDEAAAPAPELAALYHQRWEIKTALDELKTHLRGSKIVLRSKPPELVRQEFWGLLLAHFAIRDWMRQAADKGCRDPRAGSPTCMPLRVVRRKLAMAVAMPPSG